MARSGIREIMNAVWGRPDVIRHEVRERNGFSAAPEHVIVGRRGGDVASPLAFTTLECKARHMEGARRTDNLASAEQFQVPTA